MLFCLQGVRVYWFGLLLLAPLAAAFGQAADMVFCTDTTYCEPSVMGMPRSKAVEFSYEGVIRYPYTASSTLTNPESMASSIADEKRFQIKVKFPLYLGESWKVAAGFQYFNEEFQFNDLDNPDFVLGDVLDERNLKSIGGRIYAAKAWKGKHYFALRAGADLNGDYGTGKQPKGDYLRISVAPLFGVKKDPNTLYGFGLAWGYNFGRPSVYPFLVYNKTFNSNWGLETILPAKAAVRVNFSESMLLYTGFQLEGASYTIDPQRDDLDRFSSLHLQKSEIRLYANLEREIHDFLWMQAEVGIRFNNRFELTNNAIINPVSIVDVQRQPAFYFRTGIFLVPPKKFLD